MFEQHFRKGYVRRRLESSLLAGPLVELVDRLARRGHTAGSIQTYVQATEHFGRWLQRANQTIADVHPGTVEVFLTRHLPHCRCPPPRSRSIPTLRAALRQLLAVMPRASSATLPPTPIDDEVTAFEGHLRETCGLTAATRCYYVRYVRELLVARFGTSGRVDLGALKLAEVAAFVTARGARLAPGSANTVATAVRSFLRYLQLQGLGTARWADAVPRAACWRLATLPRVLSDDQLRAFLAGFDRETPAGQRDHAMALCFTSLGLRVAEVAQITLDDIDWRAGILTLAPSKARRADRHPLPPQVAAAIAAYLHHGRPRTVAREIFVHHRAPRGQPLGPSGVRCAMRQAYDRVDFGRRPTGTHVLRHTAACRLLRAGASMKEIADVLRHRSLDTSAIYAKVDLPTLSDVALPWPEVRS
jgi:integrase/recombinase XerD